MAAKKSLKEIKIKDLSSEATEINLLYNGNKWRIVTLYSRRIEETMGPLLEHIQEEEEEYLLLGGEYFNARTGSEGGPLKEEREGEKSEIRSSIDKVINREGPTLLNRIEERGWTILNGSFEKEGGWTYIGETRTSVIDYVMGNIRATEEVKMVEEHIRTESDHIPLEVELIGLQVRKRKKKNTMIEIKRSDWLEEGVKRYQENCRGWTSTQNETESI